MTASKKPKHLRRKSDISANDSHISAAAFAIFNLENEKFASIVLLVGNASGTVFSLRIVPQGGGRYGVEKLSEDSSQNSKIIYINALEVNSAKSADASQANMTGLRGGSIMIDAVIVIASTKAFRLVRPSFHKICAREIDGDCLVAKTVRHIDGAVLISMLTSGPIALAIPSFKEISHIRLPSELDLNRFRMAETKIMDTGDVFVWVDSNECALFHVWGRGIQQDDIPKDELYNPVLKAPSRPQISTLQWVSGTQFMSSVELDLLIGGPNRPPPKISTGSMERPSNQQELAAKDTNKVAQGTYFSQMTRNLNERTQKLNILEDTFNNIEESSARWMNDASEFAKAQQKKAAFSALKGSFF